VRDKQNNQLNSDKNKPNRPVEDSTTLNPGSSTGIRSSLLSSQVQSKPLVGEDVFNKSQTSQVPATEVTTTRKLNSKLVGLVAVLVLLFLAGTGLFFAYAAYKTSFNKIQNSKLSNSIGTT
jgi:hypothetical protein